MIDSLFKSRKSAADVKDEIIKYVQALETNYTELIRSLKDIIERERKEARKDRAQECNIKVERNDLEQLFVECIEEVRKEIMRRRLKNEIYSRKKFHQVDQTVQEAKDFEESLLRLAQLAKNRVKLIDFTQKDKYHLLDLFVNNEKTLLKVYEALFPHRTANILGSASQMDNSVAQNQQSHMSGLERSTFKERGNSEATNIRTRTNIQVGPSSFTLQASQFPQTAGSSHTANSKTRPQIAQFARAGHVSKSVTGAQFAGMNRDHVSAHQTMRN